MTAVSSDDILEMWNKIAEQDRPKYLLIPIKPGSLIWEWLQEDPFMFTEYNHRDYLEFRRKQLKGRYGSIN